MDIVSAILDGFKDGVIYCFPLSLVYVVIVWIVKSIMLAIFKGKEVTLATIACALPGIVTFFFALGQESFDKYLFAVVMMICGFGFFFAYLLFVKPLLNRTVEQGQLSANSDAPSNP